MLSSKLSEILWVARFYVDNSPIFGTYWSYWEARVYGFMALWLMYSRIHELYFQEKNYLHLEISYMF